MRKLKLIFSLLIVSILIIGIVNLVQAEENETPDEVNVFPEEEEEEAITDHEESEIIEALDEEPDTETGLEEEDEYPEDEGVTESIGTFFTEADINNPNIWYDVPDNVVTLASGALPFRRLLDAIAMAPEGEITHIIIPFHINSGGISGDGITNAAGSGSVTGIRPGATVVLIGQHESETTSILEPNDRRIIINDNSGGGASRLFRIRGDGQEGTALVFRNIVLQAGATTVVATTNVGGTVAATPPAPASGAQTGGDARGPIAIENGTVVAGTLSAMTNGTVVSPGGGGHVVLCRGAVIRNATSNNFGGAVEVQGAGRLTLQDGAQIINNRSDGSGAGVSVAGPIATFTMNGGLIEGNSARDGAGANGNNGGGGGGVHIQQAGGTFNMHGGIIRNNRAGANAAGTGHLEGVNRNGGGVRVHNGTFNWYGGEIYHNSASNGGGISIANGTVNINHERVLTGNTATGTGALGIGGGIHVAGGHLHLHHGEITENAANTLGGGVGIAGGEMTLHDGGEIHHNHFLPAGGGNGGGVYVRDGTFTLAGGSIHSHGGTGNQTVQNGGGIFLSGGTVITTGGEIRDNVTTGDGGGIGVTGTGATSVAINIQGGTIRHNIAGGNGGGIGITRTASPGAAITGAAIPIFDMTGGYIQNNTASQFSDVHFAPVVNNTVAGTVTTTMPNNTFNVSGTAIVDEINYAPNITQTKNGTTGGAHNTMTLNLGGQARVGELNVNPSFNVSGTGTTAARSNTFHFMMADQVIVENRMAFGGNFAISAGGTAAANNSVRNNVLNFTMAGGTLHEGIDFTPHLSVIGGNAAGTAANNPRRNTVNFNMDGGIIQGGNSINGGGIRFEPTFASANGFLRENNTHFNLNGGIIQGGIAEVHGGGIFHQPNSTITGTGTHNIVMTMNGSLIDNNRAGEDGGGMYLSFLTTGGTVPTPTLNMNEVGNTGEITNNIAGRNGGGMFLSANLGGTVAGTISGFTGNTIVNATIDGNTATGHGGGIYIETPPALTNAIGTFTLINSSISGNTSTLDGASIWMPSVANMTIADSNLDRNTTETGDGGGLHFSPIGTGGGRTLTLNGATTISNNHASTGHGGGIFTGVGATLLEMNDGYVANNTASGSGGGIYVSTGTLTMHQGVINENVANIGETPTVATVGGGGVFANDQVVLHIHHGTFSGNRVAHRGGTTGGGGGIHARGVLNLHSGEFRGNRAEIQGAANSGGGAIFYTGSNINITGSQGALQFEDNWVHTGQGGAIRTTSGGNITFANGGTILNNSASASGGGIAVLNHDTPITLNFHQVDIEENVSRNNGYTAGFLAIGNGPDVTVNLHGGTLIGNSAHGHGGAIMLNNVMNPTYLTIEGTRIEDNFTRGLAGDGGAIRVMGGTDTTHVTIRNAILAHNQTLRYGGAIFLASGALTLENNIELTHNTALNGAGLYVEHATVVINGGEITANTADHYGGGIYVTETSHLQLEETRMTGNHAGSHGGAIFTENNEYFVDTLSPTSYSNLTITDAYFNDNTAGTGSFVSPELNGQEITATGLSVGNVPEDNPLNNYDINFEGSEETFYFSFIKMNRDFDQVLQGAEFVLQAYQGGEWVVIATVESDEDGRVEFEGLTSDTLYRLVETRVPYEYRLPEGHWLIEISEAGEPTIIAEGSLVPAFRVENDTYFLGNMLEFDLPILGGLGINTKLVVAGLLIILVSSCMILIVRRRRKSYDS